MSVEVTGKKTGKGSLFVFPPILNTVETSTYIYFKVKNNDKDPKFEVVDYMRISKYKNIFAKSYTRTQPDENFVIKKIKSTVPWIYVIQDLNGEEIVQKFYEKELKKTN